MCPVTVAGQELLATGGGDRTVLAALPVPGTGHSGTFVPDAATEDSTPAGHL